MQSSFEENKLYLSRVYFEKILSQKILPLTLKGYRIQGTANCEKKGYEKIRRDKKRNERIKKGRKGYYILFQ